MAFPGRTNVYDADDIRSVIPEANDPIVQVWAPQLKNERSFWLVGSSRVSRVKASAIADNALVNQVQGMITGTASENYEKVEVLGKVRIFLYKRFYIEAYVTRSTNVAPHVADGIFGLDDIKAGDWELQKLAGGMKRLHDNLWMPFISRQKSIPDYMDKLRDRIRKTYKANETADAWEIVSKRLKNVRSQLPPELAQEDNPTIIEILDDYSDCFYLPGDKLKPTKLITYSIKSTEPERISIGQPSYSVAHWDLIEKHIKNLLQQGIIAESSSPYNFPMGLMEKKPDSRGKINYRVMVNYTQLNACSEAEPFFIPTIYDVADELNGSRYFSVLDLASAAYQIPLAANDRPKTAFSTLSGHYEFQRMPCAIKNSAEYLQRLMMKVVEGLRDHVAIFQDDVLIHTPTIEEHELVVQRVLARVRHHGLKLNPGKCQLFSDAALYLGFLVTSRGLLPDPAKIAKLTAQERPRTAEDLRSHIGLLSTHKRFLPDYAGNAKPMSDLLKEPIFGWSREAAESYEAFQETLSHELLLRYPNWNRPFTVRTGFTEHGIWATLLQKSTRNAKPRPIAHDSRVYTPAEKRYDDVQRDNLASTYGAETFRRYVQKTRSSLAALTQNLKING